MKISDIYALLDEISPFALQENWDNSGLNIGAYDKDVSAIYLSLDVDRELLEKLPKNTLLITHHPLIFTPLKSINTKEYPANLIEIMIQKDISLISMHTNFDKTHLNRYVFEDILGFKTTLSDNFVLYANIENSDFKTLYKKVCDKLSLGEANFVDTKSNIEKIALTTGSGASLISTIKADCFLTGDIKYHDAMMAKSISLSMIDISHFHSEKYFAELLNKNLKITTIPVIISNSKNPFG
jgi:dinuclear metal center YbgI/SA1388 family protein